MNKDSTIKAFFKKLSPNDYLTIAVFTVGIIYAVTDISMLFWLKDLINKLSNAIFFAAYFVAFFFLIYTLKLFVKSGAKFRLLDIKDIKNLIRLILIGYYLGFLINISNAFIMVLFEKFFMN